MIFFIYKLFVAWPTDQCYVTSQKIGTLQPRRLPSHYIPDSLLKSCSGFWNTTQLEFFSPSTEISIKVAAVRGKIKKIRPHLCVII